MRFTKIFSIAAAASSVSAQLSSQQLVKDIGTITQISDQTRATAEQISIFTIFFFGPQVVNNFRQIVTLVIKDVAALSGGVTVSQATIAETKQISEAAAADAGKTAEFAAAAKKQAAASSSDSSSSSATHMTLRARQTAPGLDANAQRQICAAFRSFVTTHQQLLAVVIGKNGVFSLTPLTALLAAALRVLEAAVDTLAFEIIDSVPVCAAQATADKNALDQTLDQATAVFKVFPFAA